MNVLDICLDILQCDKRPFSQRDDAHDEFSEPCCIVEADGRFFCSAVPELLPFLKQQTTLFDEAVLEEIADRCRRYIRDRSMVPDKMFSIIRSYEIAESREEGTKAVRLSGTEDDLLLSDIAGLVRMGPVFGVFEEGKVVSLCGGVLRDGFAEVYAETAPRYRRRGYAAACLAALAKDLIGKGHRVLYECREENVASRCTVERCGGALICRSIRFKGRK